MPKILIITTLQEWEKAIAEGQYRGDDLATEGFLHASRPDQLPWVVETFYKGKKGLLVLRIDTEMLTSPLNWETPPGMDEVFPHLYGPLNLDAVMKVEPLDDVLGKKPGVR
jgi:uncharacterized protein (DUF952 family)